VDQSTNLWIDPHSNETSKTLKICIIHKFVDQSMLIETLKILQSNICGLVHNNVDFKVCEKTVNESVDQREIFLKGKYFWVEVVFKREIFLGLGSF
jgi:hypothetical protein